MIPCKQPSRFTAAPFSLLFLQGSLSRNETRGQSTVAEVESVGFELDGQKQPADEASKEGSQAKQGHLARDSPAASQRRSSACCLLQRSPLCQRRSSACCLLQRCSVRGRRPRIVPRRVPLRHTDGVQLQHRHTPGPAQECEIVAERLPEDGQDRRKVL